MTIALTACAAPAVAPTGSASLASPSTATSASLPVAASVPVELDPAPIELVESGFSLAAQGGSASFGAVLHNPNATWAAVRIEVHVDFLAADGAFIAGEEPVVTILPGQTTAIGGLAAGAEGAASMEVRLPDDVVAFQPREPIDGTFQAQDVQTVSVGDQTTTTGWLASTFPTEQRNVQLIAIYRDAAGAIVGGAGGGVELVPPGSSVTFEIIEVTPSAEIAATEVYWQATR